MNMKQKRISNKKAQTALFIIIAIAIIVLIAILFFFMRGRTKETIESEQDKLALVDPQVRPVYLYMDDYLQDVVEDGLEILRLQGGYIYLPLGAELAEVETFGKHVRNEDNKIELIESSGKTMIPLWVGEGDSINVPSKGFMGNQLGLYIEDKLAELSFAAFEDQGMEIDSGQIRADVFLDRNARIEVTYPIEIDFKDQSFTFEEFSQSVAINFNELYDVISALVMYEISGAYLEKHANSLISLYSYAGEDSSEGLLPPTHFIDTNTDGSFVTWVPEDVKDLLSEIFVENFPSLKIAQTNFERIKVDDAFEQGVFDSFIYDLFPEMDNIHVDFYYNPNNRLEFGTIPSNLIPDRTAQTKIPFLPNFVTFKYDFKYTVSTPIAVRVKDDNSASFSAEGYEFYFPMKLDICNNKERACGRIIEFDFDLSDINQATGLNFYDCQDVDYQKTITARDIETNNLLKDVDVTHYCEGHANNCWLGRTNIDGEAVINIPKCDNASTLELNKNQYQTVIEEVKDSYVLEEIKDYNLEVMFVRSDEFAAGYYLSNGFTQNSCGKSPEALLEASLFAPAENDQVMITISNIAGTNNIFALYPEDEKISFAGGSYKINTMVQSEVEIQPSYFSGEYISFNTEDNEAPYEGKWLLGASDNEFIIDPSELQGKDTVTIYAFVEHLSTEELTVENIQAFLVGVDGITGEVHADSDCDGVEEIVTVNIPKANYNNFIKPKFIKKI